jgi:hypothetical protein
VVDLEVMVGLVAKVVVVLAEEVDEEIILETMINGVDVLDLTCAFTIIEWERLAWNGGCQY